MTGARHDEKGRKPLPLTRLQAKILTRLCVGEVVNPDWWFNVSGQTKDLHRHIDKLRGDLGRDIVTIVSDHGSFHLTERGRERVESVYGVRL